MTGPRVCPDDHLRPRLVEITRIHPLYRPAAIAITVATTAAVPLVITYQLARELLRKARRP